MSQQFTPTRIVLHHTATESGRVADWQEIRRYHVKSRGLEDIGYHFGIAPVKDGWEILCGRLPVTRGDHTPGANHDSIGICFVGRFDDRPPPPEQWLAGVKLVSWLCRLYNIPPGRIYGHRELSGFKSCPGASFDLGLFREHAAEAFTKHGIPKAGHARQTTRRPVAVEI